MSIGLDFKSPAALAPNKRVSLSFEALKSGTDFSFLSVKILDDMFLLYREEENVLKLCCLV